MKSFAEFKKALSEQTEEGQDSLAFELIKLIKRFPNEFQFTKLIKGPGYPILNMNNNIAYVFINDEPEKITVYEVQTENQFKVTDSFQFTTKAIVDKIYKELKNITHITTSSKHAAVGAAFKKGQIDAKNGFDKEDSPYDANSKNTQMWQSGWEQARQDLK